MDTPALAMPKAAPRLDKIIADAIPASPGTISKPDIFDIIK